ncbi:MAG: DNA polymerase III subunit gamma/tau [Candidatus Promineifilaceae bacterium]
MTQALYRKWRPARFGDVVGQQHVTQTLQNALVAGRLSHAYLFAGPRGTGKTTNARLLAKAVNCLAEELSERPCGRCAPCRAIAEGRYLDLIEIDAASNTGVDDIRALRDKINFAPAEGRYKVYIIDEVHMLSIQAFNALLKTLEEPPPHAIFILATTEEHKLPVTIKSRCQHFAFRLLTADEIAGRLDWLAEQEQLTIEPEAVALLASYASGSIRDAESLLDQLIAMPGDTITLKRAQELLGAASSAAVRGLTDAWLNADGPAGLRILHEALGQGADARQFARQIVAYLRQLLLLQTAGERLASPAGAEEREAMLAQAGRASRPALMAALRSFSEAATAPAGGWQPQLPLELAFVELLPAERAPGAASAPDGAQPAAAQPETETPAAPADAPAPTTDQGEQDAAGKWDVAAVRAKWPAVRERSLALDRSLSALLASAEPLAVEGDLLVVGFKFPLLKEKFDGRPGAQANLAAVLNELTGLECRVRTVLSADYAPAGEPINPTEFAALAEELGGVVRDG